MTDLGSQMSDYPLEPQLAKLLLSSPKFKCVNEILTIVAMLSVPMVFLRPREDAKNADNCKSKFAHEDGDHITLVNAFMLFKLKGET